MVAESTEIFPSTKAPATTCLIRVIAARSHITMFHETGHQDPVCKQNRRYAISLAQGQRIPDYAE